MTFQTLEYILNGIVHANITAVHYYKTATALIHKLRKIMTAKDAKWQSTQCKSRFSLANYYHSAFHTLIFRNRVGKQAKNTQCQIEFEPKMHIAHTHWDGQSNEHKES